MNAKMKKYEFTSLFNVYVSDEASETSIKSCFEFLTEEQFKIITIEDKGRFEIQHKKVTTKINLMCCTFSATPEALKIINKNTKQKTEMLRYLIISLPETVHFLDYKKPIEMKKYIFESLRIMPNELTGFSKKTQKLLASNIKRARILGLIGKFNK